MTVSDTRDADRPSSLSEGAIVSAALELLAEGGVPGLTMRALSTRLGVALGATYNHVSSKHELLKLVAESLYAQLEPGPADADGFMRARSVMIDVHHLLGAYPGMAAYMGQHLTEFSSPSVAKLVLDPLCEAGLDTADAKRVTLALVLLTAGDLLLNLDQDGRDADSRPDDTFVETLDLLLDGARSRIA
jgi:AcrR family transcriptional regulator